MSSSWFWPFGVPSEATTDGSEEKAAVNLEEAKAAYDKMRQKLFDDFDKLQVKMNLKVDEITKNNSNNKLTIDESINMEEARAAFHERRSRRLEEFENMRVEMNRKSDDKVNTKNNSNQKALVLCPAVKEFIESTVEDAVERAFQKHVLKTPVQRKMRAADSSKRSCPTNTHNSAKKPKSQSSSRRTRSSLLIE